MTPKTEIVQLDAEASVSAMRASMARAAGMSSRVALLLDANSQALANPARLRLIARQAQELGIQVALVTPEPITLYHAKKLGLATFGSVRRAERARRWRNPASEAPIPDRPGPGRTSPPPSPGLGRKRKHSSVHRSNTPDLPGRRQSRWLAWADALKLMAFLLITVAGLGLVLLFVVPVATVTLVPPQHPISATVSVIAATGVEDVDFVADQVPARVVQARVEGFGTVSTTGRRDAPADVATGSVLFLNRQNHDVQVPELTVVATSTGLNVRFEVTEAVTVPAGIGLSIVAGVQALKPGAEGNVPAFTISKIEGPLSLELRVINESPTEGGSEREVGVVTEFDKDALRESLLEEVRNDSYQQLGEMLREGEVVPPESVETFVMSETFDRFSGEDADTLGLRLDLIARGLSVDAQAASELAERELLASVPSESRLLEDQIAYSYGPITMLDSANQRAAFEASAESALEGSINAAQVRDAVRDLDLASAAAVLRDQFDLGAEPRIVLRPDWLGRVPWLVYRIQVRVLAG